MIQCQNRILQLVYTISYFKYNHHVTKYDWEKNTCIRYCKHTCVTSWKNCLESPIPAVDSMGALAAKAPATMFGYLSLMYTDSIPP